MDDWIGSLERLDIMQRFLDVRNLASFLLLAIILFPSLSEASRYEISYSGSNLTLTGFIDLTPDPNGIYQGSTAFRVAVVDDYEIRTFGDSRGDFIFNPSNSVIGNSSGAELDWEVTTDGIFITSPVTSTNTNGPPSTEIVRTFAGNQWLRITDSFIDYRNNSNGGNQNTAYTTVPFPLAFNTFLPNGGPFLSTLVPLPPAVLLFAPALAGMIALGRKKAI